MEPGGLGREVDIDPRERNPLFGERDHRTLHVGTQMMADENQLRRHELPPWMRLHLYKCKCIFMEEANIDIRLLPLAASAGSTRVGYAARSLPLRYTCG